MKIRRPDNPRTTMKWVATLTGLVLALTTVGIVAPAQAAVGPNTVVSLSFDDANADQTAAVSALDAAGLKGTFYIPSGFVGLPGYLTRAQLTSMAAEGHEIGGHTVNHQDLTTLSAADVSREICNDRVTLTSWGFPMTSFAYPFAAVTPAVESAVAACGYNSARGLGDIKTPAGCADCAYAETIPPADPFYIKAPDQVSTTWTLDDLKATVTNAETTGGWVELTFHHVCDTACDPDGLSVTTANLTAFTAWLAARSATNNTVVKTVNQVIGGSVKPTVPGTTTPAPGPGVNGVMNPSLETAGTAGVPSCFMVAGFGTNTPVYSTVTPGRTGQVAEKLTMTNWVNGDSKLLLTMDLGTCAPTVTPGHTYSLRAWYNSTVPTQFNVQTRNSVGVWSYWTDSPYFPASAAYAQAAWTTPAIPAGVTGIAFGLNLFQNGELVTDDYGLYDSVGAPPLAGNTLIAATPTITGTAQVGSVLTAVPGTWSPATATLTSQWLRNGTAIPGATATTYTVTAADAGTTLTVSVTGTATGYTPPTATATSLGTAIPAAPPLVLIAATPTVTGNAQIGGVLTAVPGAWTPATAALTYQWTRNGTAISGATAATYTVTAADKGATLKVNVTGSAAGYTPPTATATSAGTVVLATPVTVSRLAGADRYATAIEVSKKFAPGVARVYLASGTDYPDALSAGPAAAHFSSPVLLTQPDSLQASVKAEIQRLKPQSIIVVGGSNAISDAVLAAVKALGTTVRIGGADRYATSQLIVRNAFGAGSAATAYVASGLDFPDALAAAPAAARYAGPVVLVPGHANAVDASTVKLLKDLGTKTVKLAGGPVAVSTGIENSLKSAFGAAAVNRFAGADRYGTALAINKDAFAASATVYLATGTGFADAVVGGALAGVTTGPLYLTPSTCVAGTVLSEITRLAATKVVLFGGEAVLGSGVQNLVSCG